MWEMEFRLNFFLWAGIDFVWFGLSWFTAQLIFGQVNSIAGWPKDKVLLLVISVGLFNDFLWAFLMPNLDNFSRLIRHGELDLFLTKPVKTRFLVSTRYVEFDHFLRVVFLVIFLKRFLSGMGVVVGLTNWLGFGVLFLLGFVAFYNLMFMAVVTNIWFIRLFNINELFESLVGIGRYPTEIFKGRLRFFLTFIIPTAFVAVLPVKALLGDLSLVYLFYGALVVVFTTVISQWFWHFALKHYTSASS